MITDWKWKNIVTTKNKFTRKSTRFDRIEQNARVASSLWQTTRKNIDRTITETILSGQKAKRDCRTTTCGDSWGSWAVLSPPIHANAIHSRNNALRSHWNEQPHATASRTCQHNYELAVRITRRIQLNDVRRKETTTLTTALVIAERERMSRASLAAVC